MTGKLYLIPAPLGDVPVNFVIPQYNIEIIRNLKWFIVEETRTARRFVKKAVPEAVIDQLTFLEFNEHSQKEDLSEYIKPLIEGYDVGLLSEAGLPCIADPGNLIVEEAHRKNISVKPLTGPSSIMLALMASGMNGQEFAFHGYLPVDKFKRTKKLQELEQIIFRTGQTQIFIEAPYRNQQLFDSIIQTCSEGLKMCIATELTTENEDISVKFLKEWKRSVPTFHKKPAVFLLNR